MEEKTMIHEWLSEIAGTLETLAEQVKELANVIELDTDVCEEAESGGEEWERNEI